MKRFRIEFASDSSNVGPIHAGIPTRVSLPIARGQVFEVDQLCIKDGQGRPVLIQSKPLKYWPDSSIRWCLFEFLRAPGEYFVEVGKVSKNIPVDGSKLEIKFDSRSIAICNRDLDIALDGKIQLRHDGRTYDSVIKGTRPQEQGPVRFTQELELEFHSGESKSPLHGCLLLNTYATTPLVGMEFVIRNPQAMDHPGGNWDLGASGAVLIEDLSFRFTWRQSTSITSIGGDLHNDQLDLSANQRMQVFQASSGGDNWNSQNHVDRFGVVPLKFRGYKALADDSEHLGQRCSPVITAFGKGFACSVGGKDFWQNFPRVLEVDRKSFRVGLFPRESEYEHELQGGEQKTHEFALELRSHESPSCLHAFLHSSVAHVDLSCYSSEEAWPCLTQRNQDSQQAYEFLINLALQGNDTFKTKAEAIDQFGWRNFGDIYGDHEAVFHRGPTPMISHYNNQYDCVLGFAIQFMRTGDRRWWDMMIQMADHAWDIDTYHTDKDKLLYNHGLFWHTYHYADAHTSTHRSYPKRLRQHQSFDGGQDLAELGETGQKLAKNYAIGGGPAAAHNYNTGWMVAYWLTGCERYREAAISAADYVMGIEDGSKTPFKWLSRADTGFSTCSSEGYYGPGRAAANSTHALLTGHELTGDKRYLERVATLMRRTVHPREDLSRLDLLNAELRWFYTMYLQSLGRYVDYKDSLGERDGDFYYGVAALLHYAHWMEQHERPTLSEPEKLQYPTETWAAQDMRKWHILEHAAMYECDAEKRQRLRTKADFFFDEVITSLSKFETRSLCRPVILMLNFGWQRQWYLSNRDQNRLSTPIELAFPNPIPFKPQRQIAMVRFKRLVLAGAACLVSVVGLALVMLIYWQLS